MSEVITLIESVLESKFGFESADSRWMGKTNQWLIKQHGTWIKLDLTGEGFGDMLILTALIGNPPANHLAEFNILLLEKNLELPGPSLWVKDGLFGLREVRYTDGLQDIELVDMIELMSEVARETREELLEIYDRGINIFDSTREADLRQALLELGVGI